MYNKRTKFDPTNFDMTTYLSAPNFINCCNGHVGRVLQLEYEINNEHMQKFGAQDPFFLKGFLSINGHSLSYILNLFDQQTGKPLKCRVVDDWPISIEYKDIDESNWMTLVKHMVPSDSVLDKLATSTVACLIKLMYQAWVNPNIKINEQYIKYFKLQNDLDLKVQAHYKSQEYNLDKEDILNNYPGFDFYMLI